MKRLQKLLVIIAIVVFLASFLVQSTSASELGQNIPPTEKKSVNTESETTRVTTVSSFGVEVKDDTSTLELVNDDDNEPRNHWVRINGLLWSDVQPNNKDQLIWDSALDDKLQAAHDTGMEIILVIRSTPSWAQQYINYFCGPIASTFIDEFADFMQDAVSRYSSPPNGYTYSVKYYEIWNEPDDIRQEGLESNHYGCWGNPEDKYFGGEYYGDVLKAIYPQVKNANSEAQVVLGGLLLPCDPDSDNDYCNMSNFFEGVLQTEKTVGWPYFDYVAYHGCPFYDNTLSAIQHETPSNDLIGDEVYWTGWNDRGGLVEGKLNYIKEIMIAYGVNKPILLTESGLTDRYNNADADIAAFEATKADYLVWLYTRNLARGLDATVWYTLDNNIYWGKSSLLDEDKNPLPAYNAYDILTSTLDGAVYLNDLDSLGNGILGFEFTIGNRIWVLFSEDGAEKSINTPLYFSHAYDLFGESLAPSGGKINFNRPIYIEFLNTPPEAKNDSYGLYVNETLTIDPPGVLVNDTDADGDPLIAKNFSNPTLGSLTPNGDGSFTYVPEADYIGPVIFTYNASDGSLESNIATVTITIRNTPCLSVNPDFLVNSLIPNSFRTSTLSVTNNCAFDVNFELIERSGFLEDFEEGVMPPSRGWTIKENSLPYYNWTIVDAQVQGYEQFVDEGRYSAWVNYNPDSSSDEWLLTPLIYPADLSELHLSFRARSDTRHPSATMKIWVTDETGDPITDYSTDPVWDMIRDENWSYSEYRSVSVDLNDFASYADPIRIAWQYKGKDGQSFGLDMVKITTSESVPWLSVTTSTYNLTASDTINILVYFDSSGYKYGDYFASYDLVSVQDPLIQVPVIMRVEYENNIYLPIILR